MRSPGAKDGTKPEFVLPYAATPKNLDLGKDAGPWAFKIIEVPDTLKIVDNNGNVRLNPDTISDMGIICRFAVVSTA